jgi:SAM-dependent methyltransferase
MSTIDYYNDNAEDFVRQTQNLDMEALYEPFLKLIPSNGNILDAGCGAGRDTKAFIEKGYHVTAFDASPKMVAAAQRLTGLPVMLMQFEELNFDQEFDGIWACASLLHVRIVDMPGVLQRLHRALKPNGVLYASFKEGANQERIKDGRLFVDYDEIGIQKLIIETMCFAGLQISRTVDVRQDRATEYWLNAVCVKSKGRQTEET